MDVYFLPESPLDRLETDSSFSAGFPPETVDMYRCRLQQLRASLNELDVQRMRSLDLRLLPGKEDGFCSIFLCREWRLSIHLLGSKPRSKVAVLEITQVNRPTRRAK